MIGVCRCSGRSESVFVILCGQHHPDAFCVLTASDRSQRLTFARAGDTFAILDQKQRAVGGALNQAGAAVQKPVRLPLQRNTAMRTAIGVDENPALSAHRQKPVAVQLEASAF